MVIVSFGTFKIVVNEVADVYLELTNAQTGMRHIIKIDSTRMLHFLEDVSDNKLLEGIHKMNVSIYGEIKKPEKPV